MSWLMPWDVRCTPSEPTGIGIGPRHHLVIGLSICSNVELVRWKHAASNQDSSGNSCSAFDSRAMSALFSASRSTRGAKARGKPRRQALARPHDVVSVRRHLRLATGLTLGSVAVSVLVIILAIWLQGGGIT